MLSKFAKGCPSDAEIARIIKKRNQTADLINQIRKILVSLDLIIKPIQAAIPIIKPLVDTLKFNPIPSAVGGVGVPIGTIVSSAELLNDSKRKIEELEQKIANNAAPKIEEQKPIPKPEAKTAYEPKKEPNQNNKLKETKKDYSSLSEYAKAQGYESNQAEVDELIKDAENDFAVREDKRKHRMKVQNQMESDILRSILSDIVDVTNYIKIIDKTYS